MTASLRNRRLLLASLAFVVPLTAAVACSQSAPPPIASGGDTDASLAFVDARPGASDASDAATADGATDDAPSGDTAADTAPSTSDAADSAPPLCSPPEAGLGGGTLVISTPNPDLLGGITPDELVIAWTSVVAGDAGASGDGGASGDAGVVGVVSVAERAHATDAFGAPQTIDPSFGPFAADHVALSGDGLRLVFVSPDSTHMTELSRAMRGAAFDTVTTNADFGTVNPLPGPDGTGGIGPFAFPTLTPDFALWAFIRGASGFVLTHGKQGVWSAPPSLPLGISKRAEPTGWSADALTLFYWDPNASIERMAWRDPTSGAFSMTIPLGGADSGVQYAVPSGSCSTLYYSAPGAAGDLDIYVAPIQ